MYLKSPRRRCETNVIRTRVQKYREFAEQIAISDPDGALVVLNEAKVIQSTPEPSSPSLIHLMRQEFAGFFVGSVLVFCGIPLVMGISLGVVGFVVLVLKVLFCALLLAAFAYGLSRK